MNSTRWGILGTGSMAELFAQALLSVPGAKITAVAARTKDRADRFAAEYRIPKSLDSHDRLFEMAELDVVYVSTPNDYHSEHCLKAIRAGKAVLCEKPFALTAHAAAEVVELARSNKVFCMEAMWMRFAPTVREALSIIREGKLGPLRHFSAQLGFPYSPDPESRLFRKPGGGALFDLGVYPLSLAQAIFGNPTQICSSVEFGSTGVDEHFSAILRYKDGSQATIAASLRAQLQNSASIHGERGLLQLAEPLYFPESYRMSPAPEHKVNRRPGKMAKFRHYPIVRSLAKLRNALRSQTVSKPSARSGYSFEALEVQRCLHAGLLESPDMSLGDTLAVMESMDSIRSQWPTP
jgi:predicted dehydrogenase